MANNKIEKAGKKGHEIIDNINTPSFKGYTMEELRYQRALVAMKKEFCKESLLEGVAAIQNHSLFGKKPDGVLARNSRLGGIAGKLMSGLNYVDYAVMGMSIFNSAKKVLGLFRRKK